MNLKRCYHKNISAHEAEKLLLEKDVGSFLCRPSTDRSDYSLSIRRESIRREGRVTHIKIQNHGTYVGLSGGGDPFPTLHDLIKCYHEKGGLAEKNGEFIKLLHPVNCKYPTSERWFHGLMSGLEAQELLLGKGRKGSYLVRESANRLGHYVISIRCEDHVKQVKVRNCDGKYDLGGEPSFPSLGKLMEFYSHNPMVEENSSTILHLKQPFNSTTFIASGIADRINELQQESSLLPGKDGFREELEQLQQPELRHLYTRKIGMLPENKDKNRFKNIVPFDHSRVILRNNENDYINASYISAENGNFGCEYIATQGCLAETIAAFLQMVYQENSRIILMVSPETERSKEVCAKYWPDVESSIKVEHFTVKNLKEDITHEFIKRELEFINVNDPSKEPYIVYQYQYLAWPETSQPENIGSVLGILNDISLLQKRLPESGPVVVHCNNGIGRTASIIVIDMIVKLLQRDGLECELDIQKMVQHVRTQRFDQMVQLEAQYKLIYFTIAHHVEMEMSLCFPPPETRDPYPPPPKSHRSPPKPPSNYPPTIIINGAAPPPMAAPPPIPERKAGSDQSMSHIFNKTPAIEDPKTPDTPPPIPERKKGN